MSVQLLDKTRKINKLLHNNNSSKVVFNDICDVLKEILESNILVISKKGKVLGTGVLQGVEEINELIVDEVGGFIDPLLNERLLGILSTKENVNLETLGFVDDVKKYTAIITPIDIAGERLGTLFVYRENRQYDIDDIILSEYGTTVVGLEMMRSVNEENAEETRKVQIVKSAISTLSFSELEAITHIFDEMDGKEGILVASKIADRVGITRSVIVNALRKFESAGVIESRSSGMKGTYIKVLNDVVFDELAHTNHNIGIDLGIKDLCITSDGKAYENLKIIKKYEKQLVKLQRQLSHKGKRSKNYYKTKKKIAICHEKIRNMRKDYLHKVSHEIISENQVIVSENLQIKNMVKNHHLAKAISDVSWYELTRQLEYKAKWNGRKYIKIDTFYASSQLCSVCGYQNPDTKDLSVRTWICPKCGAEHDRDINAAKNILTEGLRQIAQK